MQVKLVLLKLSAGRLHDVAFMIPAFSSLLIVMFWFFILFFVVWFLETEFHSAQAALRHAVLSCLSLLGARRTGVHHQPGSSQVFKSTLCTPPTESGALSESRETSPNPLQMRSF